MSEPQKLTIVQDDSAYCEAAYLNGLLMRYEDTLYACEIADICDGKPTVLEFRNVDFDDDWPQLLSELPLGIPAD